LYDYDEAIEHVYFPEDLVASIVGVMADGSAVEAATVGNEGFVGMPVFFGGDRMAAQAFVQVEGDALFMHADDFRAVVAEGGVRELFGRYTQAMLTQIAQSSACNRVHAMVQRCARWLLQTHDRVGRDEFPLTQDFLAQMLGVRPATVGEVAGTLADAGAIRYGDSKMTIVNRATLERLACECYAIIAREYARLIDGQELPNPLINLPTSDHGRSVLTPPNTSE